MQIRHIDQQRSDWFESDFCLRSASYIATLSITDDGPFLRNQNFAEICAFRIVQLFFFVRNLVISVGIYAISREGERFPHTDFATGSNWLRGFGALTNRNLFRLEVTLLHILLRFWWQNFAEIWIRLKMWSHFTFYEFSWAKFSHFNGTLMQLGMVEPVGKTWLIFGQWI